MTTFDEIDHVLKVLDQREVAGREPKQLRNQPNATVRVYVELEIDVPVWKSVDENGPDVTIDEWTAWKIAPVDERLRKAVEGYVEDAVYNEWRELELAAEKSAHHARYEP